MVQANFFNDGPFIFEASFLPLCFLFFEGSLYWSNRSYPCGGGSFSRSYLFSSLEKSQRRNNLEGGTGWILKEERLHCRNGGGTYI